MNSQTLGQMEAQSPDIFKNPPQVVKVWVDVREGRKVIQSNSVPFEKMIAFMAENGIKTETILINVAGLREGKNFTFKLHPKSNKSLTVKPLVGHTDLY